MPSSHAEQFGDITPDRADWDTHPRTALRSLFLNRSLIYSLARREVLGRYRGSLLGLAWSFFTPALMLVVYTFFFGIVFTARWPRTTGSTAEFALILFSGLIVFNLFSECLNRAPAQIVSNANFVKRVIFPLEVLNVVNLASASFHAVISFAAWLLFYFVLIGIPHPEILLVPVALIPLLLLVLGLGWFLSSLGVFLRDLGQVVGPVTASLMFLSPIFYPLSALGGSMKAVVSASPLTFAVETARNAMMWGEGIPWGTWLWHLLGSATFAALGFAWFQKTRKGFADVL